jgi:hypothetical protein
VALSPQAKYTDWATDSIEHNVDRNYLSWVRKLQTGRRYFRVSLLPSEHDVMCVLGQFLLRSVNTKDIVQDTAVISGPLVQVASPFWICWIYPLQRLPLSEEAMYFTVWGNYPKGYNCTSERICSSVYCCFYDRLHATSIALPPSTVQAPFNDSHFKITRASVNFNILVVVRRTRVGQHTEWLFCFVINTTREAFKYFSQFLVWLLDDLNWLHGTNRLNSLCHPFEFKWIIYVWSVGF